MVRDAQDVCATPPASISVSDLGLETARLKHVSLYIRRTELRAQEAIFINFDTAALYLSHMLEVRSDDLLA